jgi:hypothetical protein
MGRIVVDLPHLTYANIGVFPSTPFFSGLTRGEPLKLFPWIYRFLGGQRVTGEHYDGVWHNIGTPDQLGMLNDRPEPAIRLQDAATQTPREGGGSCARPSPDSRGRGVRTGWRCSCRGARRVASSYVQNCGAGRGLQTAFSIA